MDRIRRITRQKLASPARAWAAAALAFVALCSLAASASAKPADVKAARVTLGAYKQFLGALDAQIPASTQAADAFIASISNGCPNALSPLSSQTSANVDAITAVGTEAVLDIGIAADTPDRAALAKFDQRASRVRWTARGSRLTAQRYFAAMHALYWLPSTDLCGDARTLAASGGQTTPAGTTQALASVASAGKAATVASSTMQKLSRFATSADARVVNAIKKLLSDLNSDQQTIVQREAAKLLTALGFQS